MSNTEYRQETRQTNKVRIDKFRSCIIITFTKNFIKACYKTKPIWGEACRRVCDGR